MPIYRITNPNTGETLRVKGDTAPTQADAAALFASRTPSAADSTPPSSQQQPSKNKDISWLDEALYAFDAADTDIENWHLAMEAFMPSLGIPNTKLTIGKGDDLIGIETEEDRHGTEWANLKTYEERREFLQNKKKTSLEEEHADVIEFQQEEGISASADLLGSLAGTLATPTTLTPFGKTLPGALAVGAFLGAETELARQSAQEGELDVSDVVVESAKFAAGAGVGHGLERAGKAVLGKIRANKNYANIKNLSGRVNEELLNGAKLGLSPKDNIKRARQRLVLNNEDMAELIAHRQVTFPTKETVIKSIATDKNIVVSHSKAREVAEKVLTPLSKAVKEISKPVFGRLKKHDFEYHKNVKLNENKASKFMQLGTKLSKGSLKQQYAKFETELANSNFAKAETIAREHFPEIIEPLKEIVGETGILNNLHKQLNEAGAKVKYRANYFPRKVKDYPGLREALGKEGNKLDGLLNKEARKQGFQSWRSLDDDDISIIINTFLSKKHAQAGTKKLGLGQKRTVKTVDSELLGDFYYTAPESLNFYITSAVREIERRKFFGKQNIVKGFDNKTDIKQTVGNLVRQEMELGRVSSDGADQLGMLLTTRFGPGEQATNKILATARDIQTVTLLAHPDSALFQLVDLGSSVYMNGVLNTIRSLVPAARKKTITSAEEFGILNNISAEINSHGGMAPFVDKFLRLSGFRGVDRFTKDTFIDAAYLKATQTAKKNPRKLAEKWGDILGDDMPKLINDLKTGKITDDVKFLLYNELAGVQPIDLSEMPELYLKNPNLRLLYSLKTFAVKQLNVVREQIVEEMVNGNYKTGFTNAARYVAIYGLIGGAVGTARDALLTKELRPEVFSDKALENLLAVAFLNRYTIERHLAQGKIGQYVEGIATPAILNIGDDIGSAAVKAAGIAIQDEETNPEVFKKAMTKLPVLGKLYYNWFLGGAERRIERDRKKEIQDYNKRMGIN